MGNVKEYEYEKIVTGIMYTSPQMFDYAVSALKEEFGEIDSMSKEYSFSEYSSFYNAEMSGNVLKRWISFSKLVDPSLISDIKIMTNEIEKRFSENDNRRINIDPCLLSHGKFVMATTKSASFRMAHNKGIYVDLSLFFSRNKWYDFFWTYYDVKSAFVKDYLYNVRKIYIKQRQEMYFH